jgi:hypothetical protein
MSHDSSSEPEPETARASSEALRHDSDPDAHIRNFAPGITYLETLDVLSADSILVARIMKTALPENAKIAKEAKECMQECVSEFISFITSEG